MMQFLPGNIELSTNEFEKTVWNELKTVFLKYKVEGILGYKLPALGYKYTEDIPSFTLRSIKYGIIVIDVVGEEIKAIEEEGKYWITGNDEDLLSRDISSALYVRDIENKLSKSSVFYDIENDEFNYPLLVRRALIFCVNSKLSIQKLQEESGVKISARSLFGYDRNDIIPFLNEHIRSDLTQEIIDEVDSILDGTSVFNKRRKRVRNDAITRNDLIKKSLNETFKLDYIQRSVALQIPNGPQRIRGLAGTGKTIILSMKAALTHTSNRKFDILFVFNTQSMYKQIIENIEKYTVEESSSSPDFDRLKVFHAWGGKWKMGLYSYLCNIYGVKPINWMEARRMPDPMQYIFSHILQSIKRKPLPLFDMILIDEAQDFPTAFFEVIFYIAKDPKRIIWAYDEFQSLSELKISEPSQIFGLDEKNKPNLPDEILRGEYEGGIAKDYMLPNSYRNPRKVLMYAHGLGLGLYSNNAKLPMEDTISWEARGYHIIQPDKKKFEQDDEVIIERPKEHSKNILESLIEKSGKFNVDNIVSYRHFSTNKDQLTKVIEGIKGLIHNDKIEPEEIIVIDLDTRNAEENFKYIRTRLLDEDHPIHCIAPGFVEGSDQFKERGRVTLTTPFRAKGNEANVVLVLNANVIINDKTYRSRNAIFVSITRSRGWCYICGHGEMSERVQEETQLIEKYYPKFCFSFPKRIDYARRLLLISNMDKNLSRAESQIDSLIKDDNQLALFMEKAKDNQELLDKLKDLFKE